MSHLSALVPLLAPAAVWAYAGCAALLSLYGLHRYLIVAQWWRARRHPLPVPPPPADWPRVTVQLPVYNERYVVERLIDAVCATEYPRDRLQVQVLDDSTDDTATIAAAAVGRHRAAGVDIVHVRREAPTGFKAGALAHGLRTATGEFIVVFDADFVPGPDVVRRAIPWFADPAVGMVQVRWGHVNRAYSLLTRVQALLLDGHFLLEHTARHRSGRFFNFNGTAGLWRRAAIADAGGWQHDTLTEDLDLSYRAQLAGWRFVFLPDVVAAAELPVDMNGFKSQQHRWAKGSVQTARKLLGAVWRCPLPWRTKLEATVHLTSNLSYLLLLALAVLAFPTVWVRHEQGWSLWWMWLDVVVVGLAVCSLGLFYACAGFAGGGAWRGALRLLPALMALGIGLAVNNAAAVLEALAGHVSPFRRTPKYGVRGRADGWHHKQYRVPLPVGAFLEAALAVYAAVAVQYAWREALWPSLPFLVLFTVGFGAVAVLSFAHWGAQYRAARGTALTPRPVAG